MTIILSNKDLEQFVRDAVRAGRYASEDEVVRDALTRLKHATPESGATPGKKARRAKNTAPAKPPITEAEFLKHLVEIGLMSQLPDTANDIDDPDDQPISITGEPLSETIIRERR